MLGDFVRRDADAFALLLEQPAVFAQVSLWVAGRAIDTTDDDGPSTDIRMTFNCRLIDPSQQRAG